MQSAFVKIVNGWPTIEPGALIHQVQILSQQPSNPPAYDAGGLEMEWPTIYSGRAAVEVPKAVDPIRYGQSTAWTYLLVTMWCPNRQGAPLIQTNMRVEWQSRRYVIQGVENVLGRNVVLELNCLGLEQNA